MNQEKTTFVASQLVRISLAHLIFFKSHRQDRRAQLSTFQYIWNKGNFRHMDIKFIEQEIIWN